MAKIEFDPGTLLCPVPAVMVSCGNENEDNIITIAWTGVINSNPPMVYISVRKERHSYDIIKRTGEFVINLTTEKLAFATDFCGVKSGRDIDKFKELGLSRAKATKVSCPMIGDSPLNLECKVEETHEYPTHTMFVAQVVSVHANDDIVDEKGKIKLNEAGLISYVHGEYFGVKKTPIGRFGFSVMKAKTRKRINKENHIARVEKNRAKRK